MKTTLRIAAVVITLSISFAAPHAADVVMSDFRVFETNTVRLAGNDSKPTLYKVRVTAKENDLWIEGDDYDYQWLMILPYEKIKGITLNRARSNPLQEEEGGWLSKQIAKAKELKSWFLLEHTGRSGKDVTLLLLAPLGADLLFQETLGGRTGLAVKVTGEEQPPVAGPPRQVTPSVPPTASTTVTEPSPPAAVEPVRLVDQMTVSDFRACGLVKLSEEELDRLDEWLTRYVSRAARGGRE